MRHADGDTLEGSRTATAVPGRPMAAVGDDCGCQVCRSSLPDLSGPRVMTAVAPMPGESLIGLVARTSAANWIHNLRPILSGITPRWHMQQNLAVRDDIDFAQLAFSCRLPRHEIEARRYRPAQAVGEMPGIVFHGATIPIYDLELRSRRVAPSWLRAGRHSGLGHHALATHCPASGELLIDSCPLCDCALGWTQSALHLCHACGFDMSRHKSVTIAPRVATTTRLMLDLICPDPARHDPATRRLPPLLRSVDRGLVFEIGWRMGCVLTGNGLYDRDTAKRLPVAKRLEILSAGSKAITAWPDSLTDALRGLRPGVGAPSLDIATQARRMPKFKNAWPDLKAAFHAAAPGLTGGPLRAVKASLRNGVNSRELEGALGVGQRVVERLRGTALTPAITVGDVNSHQIFEGAELNDLRSLLGDSIAIGTIAERTAISRHGIEQLACLGHIEIFDDGPASEAYLQRQARKSDLDGLIARLIDAQSEIDGSERVRVRHAMKGIGGREKPWGPAIAAMLDRGIAFLIDPADDRRLLDRLHVARSDVEKLVALRFDTSEYPHFGFETSINGRDTEELLNINPKMTCAARADGSLPAPSAQGYDRQAIIKLARRHIAAPEVLARWNGVDRKLPPPLRGRGGARRTNSLGWEREAVERLMAEYNL